MSTPPFRVTVDSSRVQAWMKKIPSNLRKRARAGMRSFGNVLVNNLMLSARSAGIRQFKRSRSLFTSTYAEQHGDVVVIKMPKSGLYQDRAKPHYVPVTRKLPMVYAWARQKGFMGRGFVFTPKPFIKRGKINATKSLMPIMRPQVHAAIAESH